MKVTGLTEVLVNNYTETELEKFLEKTPDEYKEIPEHLWRRVLQRAIFNSRYLRK